MAASNKTVKKNKQDAEDWLLHSSVEIIPNRFYFMSLNTSTKPKYTVGTHFFSTDDELTYDPFYDDFGPLNLAQLFKYCCKVQGKLKSTFFESRKIIHFTQNEPRHRVNAAYLVGAYAILYLNISPETIYGKLTKNASYTEFRDASTGVPLYTLSLRDCLFAVAKAKECRFFDPNDFHCSEYTHYETVENGDLNWIVPEKFIAFAGPYSIGYRNNSKWGRSLPAHPPKFYNKFFKASNVSTIIRLNNRCYESAEFKDAGFQHIDLIYPDGSTPTDDLMHTFLQAAENSRGAVAVHCKAGLGRTGSMIAAYIMKWYHFTSREAIAWIRICRPASIIGPQQEWLDCKQKQLWLAGKNLERPFHQYGVYSYYRRNDKSDSVCGLASKVTTLNINSLIADINKNVSDDTQDELSQGDHLQKIKLGRLTPLKAPNKSNRSWPAVEGPHQSKKNGCSYPTAPPILARRGRFLTARRISQTKKKTISALKTTADEEANIVASALVDNPITSVRRSNRINEPSRVNKTLNLR